MSEVKSRPKPLVDPTKSATKKPGPKRVVSPTKGKAKSPKTASAASPKILSPKVRGSPKLRKAAAGSKIGPTSTFGSPPTSSISSSRIRVKPAPKRSPVVSTRGALSRNVPNSVKSAASPVSSPPTMKVSNIESMGKLKLSVSPKSSPSPVSDIKVMHLDDVRSVEVAYDDKLKKINSQSSHYSPDSEDPLSPPSGIMGSPGATQKKRSLALLRQEFNSTTDSLASTLTRRKTLGGGEIVQAFTATTVCSDDAFGSVRLSCHASEASEEHIEHKDPTLGYDDIPNCGSSDVSGDHSEISDFETTITKPVKKVLMQAPTQTEDDADDYIQSCLDVKGTDLDLSRLNLSRIPPQIINCTMLTKLCLEENSLEVLPESLGLLVNLTHFTAGNNHLRELPAELSNCKELIELKVDQNELVELPECFSKLTKLQKVVLDWNDITEFPTCLFKIPDLKQVYLTENPQIETFAGNDWGNFSSLDLHCDNNPALVKEAQHLPHTITLHWHCVFPDKVDQYLYLGSLRSAQEIRIYKCLGITRVATIGRELQIKLDEGMEQYQVNVDDLADTDLSKLFDEVHEFIQRAIADKTGILVHCFKGQSRSATMVISYLMKTRTMSRDIAYRYVADRRPMINPNPGFMELLAKYDTQLQALRAKEGIKESSNEN